MAAVRFLVGRAALIAGGRQPLNWWECGKGGQGVSGF